MKASEFCLSIAKDALKVFKRNYSKECNCLDTYFGPLHFTILKVSITNKIRELVR